MEEHSYKRGTNMTQEQVFYNDIVSEHRDRMVNLKKYYPFFRLCDNSFAQYKEGRYDNLDMGYLTMAILRFFIEENNFKEKDVLYSEYQDFIIKCLKRDVDVEYTKAEYEDIAQYIFDKIKNDGHPFIFEYYDPVDRKKKASRMKLIDSTVKGDCVWYNITSDAIEFYLDTKETKDESKISIQQLLLEKLIKARNFKGGTEVIARINNEVSRLQYRKNEVISMLAIDVFAGIDAYEDFVENGTLWFGEEEKLFAKNMELIEATLERAEAETEKNEAYYRTISDIYQLSTQLKIAMNKHSQLLEACTKLSVTADEIIRNSKLRKLRNGFDFRNILGRMIKNDDVTALEKLVNPLFDLNIKKRFNCIAIDDLLTYRPERKEKAEIVEENEEADIVFEDEIEDGRISDNYVLFMRELLELMRDKESIKLSEYVNMLETKYANVHNNGDLYSFLVHLCQKKEYEFGKQVKDETFLDGMLGELMKLPDYEVYQDMGIRLLMGSETDCEEILCGQNEITDITFERIAK